MPKNNIISLKNITKIYDNNEVLHDISFDIFENDRLAIVGPNGNGKTTLCEIIAQIRKPSSGEVKISNEYKIGMQLQEAPFPIMLTLNDFLKYYISVFNLKLDIENFRKDLSILSLLDLMNKKVVKMSGGQKQRANILLSTIYNPDILIMDELATGLDIESKEMIYKYTDSKIKNTKCLILVTHSMEEVERFCNKIMFLFDGKNNGIYDVKKLIKKNGSIENYVKKTFKKYYDEKDKYSNSKKIKNAKENKKESWEKIIEKNAKKSKK